MWEEHLVDPPIYFIYISLLISSTSIPTKGRRDYWMPPKSLKIWINHNRITHVCGLYTEGHITPTFILKECGHNNYHLHRPKWDLIHCSLGECRIYWLKGWCSNKPGHHSWTNHYYFRRQIFKKGTKKFRTTVLFHVYTTLVFTTYFSHFYVSDLGVIAVERDENKCQLNVKGNQGKNKGKK